MNGTAMAAATDVLLRIEHNRPSRLSPHFLINGYVPYSIEKEKLATPCDIIDRHSEQCALGALSISVARINNNNQFLLDMLIPTFGNDGCTIGPERNAIVTELLKVFSYDQLILIETAFCGLASSNGFNQHLSVRDFEAAVRHAARRRDFPGRLQLICNNLLSNSGLFKPETDICG